MNIRKLQFHPIFMGLGLLSLIACSGMSSGGGPVGSGGSLDGGALGGGGTGVGGNGSGGGGPLGGGPLGDTGGSGGGAQPSTQQSSDNIGGGCARFYHVKLKVLHNGSEEACTVATAVTYRVNADDFTTTGTGTYAPPEEDGDPKVTVNIGYPITQTLACIAGQWQTAEPIFFRAVCQNYDVTIYATWQRQGKGHASNTFQGAPVPNENNDPIPIELTLDLGQDSYHVPLEDMVNAPAVY